MNINDYWLIFTNFVKENYDLEDELIELKYNHTKRVANLMILIASKMNLSTREIILAYLIGLFHDLGRFEQVNREHKFTNLHFDHGAYSNKILFNDNLINKFEVSSNLYLLIRKAVYFHNKKDIPSNLDEYEDLFVKMIRDADKIDIIRVMSNSYQEFSVPPKNELMDKYLSGDTLDLKLINNKSEKALLHLSFMKDLSFAESFEVLKETGNIESYLSNINVKEEYKELFDFLVSQIKEKEKKYVKYKI